MPGTIVLFAEHSGIFRLHACVQSCVFVCVFSCFTCVHAPGGETACVGCYLLLQRVTANHLPWQTLGERGGKREGEMTNEREKERGDCAGRGIGIWIPLIYHRGLWILSSPPLHGSGLEFDQWVVAHLAHWQLINPRRYQHTPRLQAAVGRLRNFLMKCVNPHGCHQQQLLSPTNDTFPESLSIPQLVFQPFKRYLVRCEGSSTYGIH